MRTLILKDGVSRERVGEGLSVMGLKEEPPESPADMYWKIWLSPDEKISIHEVDDALTMVQYFPVRGKKETAFVGKLKEAFPIWDRDDLLNRASFLLISGSDEERQRVAMEVATEMDEYDAASAGVLTAFLKMDERAVRLAGARALRTRPWPIFRRTAEELAADLDPEIAAIGKRMIERIRELHGDRG